ncbi:MAG TPA: NUDIX hydrolase, partial [Chthoniobacterales bacterium]|nr:NUDIX hydrolase [Chthoniobacterales bacterium]
MNEEPNWIRWAREIQAIAQTGLHFSESSYDRERYERLREIAVEIFAKGSDATESFIRASFAAQTGYATPKVDVRGVVLKASRILLVREISDGLWTLPGGWADVNNSPSEAVVREIREESGFLTRATRLIALFDRSKHGHEPPLPFHVYKLFIGCELVGGNAQTSAETSEVGFFDPNHLPPLSIGRVTPDQIAICLRQWLDPRSPALF